MSEELRLEYVPLDLAMMWDDNKKRHSIGDLVQSIERHGFKDPPKFEPKLNGGRGGIIEGNGRFEALGAMRRDGYPAPRGVQEVEGVWHVPVLFGVDAASEAAAEAYGVDHNQITLMGGDFTLWDSMRMWDAGFEEQLRALAEQDELPVSIDGDALDAMLDVNIGPPSLDDLADEYGEPDERDFWPFIRVQVSPRIYQRWQSLMGQTGCEDEAEAMALVIEAVDETLLEHVDAGLAGKRI